VTPSHDLHRKEGYQPLRYHWRMEIVGWTASRAKVARWDRAASFLSKENMMSQVWQAQNEAFRDHWGSHDVTLEEWKRSRFDDPEFDPTLWKLPGMGRKSPASH
jgi:mycothiol synthase